VGRNDNGQLGLEHTSHGFIPKPIPSLSSIIVTKAAWGLHHSVFLTKDGQIYSTGFNDNGQLGLGDNATKNKPTLVSALEDEKIVDIACGYYHTLAKLVNGEVYSFGRNDKGQWGIDEGGATSIKLPTKITDFDVPIGLQNVFGHMSDSYKTTKLLSGSVVLKEYLRIYNIKTSKIAWGCYHSILLSDTGHVFTFGRGNHGQLGHGNKDNITVPRLIYFFKDKKATDIAGGFYHTIVLVNNRVPKLNSISFDMKKLLKDSSRCDITFNVGNEVFHAHRCIILVRCKDMHVHINKEAIESDEDFREEIGTNCINHKILDIVDWRPLAFQVLLEFIYTGMVQNVQDFDSLVILDVFCLALNI
jgi:alpha-tubulin suppressor-like RCC1 family protein